GKLRSSAAPGAADDLSFPNLATMQSGYSRVDLTYRKRHGRWDFLVAPALRLDRTYYRLGFNLFSTTQEASLRHSDVIGLLRAEASVRPLRPLQLTFGVDTQLDRYLTRQTGTV